ncbi:hypothetical protein ACFPKZ_15955 [Streptosporangium amethystogenes subsp. fukuiense]|uniref:hypothetical protein n=1 Tax=Streptosporangium amethystogenes TaxID=2002 RepID=UPI003607486F
MSRATSSSVPAVASSGQPPEKRTPVPVTARPSRSTSRAAASPPAGSVCCSLRPSSAASATGSPLLP